MAPTDVDGDGSLSTTDCDDGDPAIHPLATEDCANGIDDDCDDRVDGGDAACPLSGEVEADDGDVQLSRYPGDVRPHAFPLTGELAYWEDNGNALLWFDFEDALAGTWTELARAPTGQSYTISVSALEDLPDLEGDGSGDLLVRLSHPDGTGLARFSGVPASISPSTAATFIEAVGFCGIVSDFDGDAISDAFGVIDSVSDPPQVAWVSSGLTGQLDASYADATLISWDITGYERLYYTVTRAGSLDADGDGVAETMAVMPGQMTEYGEAWVQEGYVFLVPAPPTGGTTLMDASTALLDATAEAALQDAESLGDLDGDGYDDLVASLDGAVTVFAGPFTGTFGPDTALAQVAGADHVKDFHVGDMDGDGGIDLAFLAFADGDTDGWDTFVVADPAGGGTLDAARLHVVNDSTLSTGSDLDDVDGDGRDDLLGRSIFLAR